LAPSILFPLFFSIFGLGRGERDINRRDNPIGCWLFCFVEESSVFFLLCSRSEQGKRKEKKKKGMELDWTTLEETESFLNSVFADGQQALQKEPIQDFPKKEEEKEEKKPQVRFKEARYARPNSRAKDAENLASKREKARKMLEQSEFLNRPLAKPVKTDASNGRSCFVCSKRSDKGHRCVWTGPLHRNYTVWACDIKHMNMICRCSADLPAKVAQCVNCNNVYLLADVKFPCLCCNIPPTKRYYDIGLETGISKKKQKK